MKPISKPYGLLLLACIAAIVFKNTLLFTTISKSGTWNLNRSMNWGNEVINELYASVFVTVCLLIAVCCVIYEKRKAAFYLIFVSLLAFPFHSLVQSYQQVMIYFALPYPNFHSPDQNLVWLANHLALLTGLSFTIIFTAALFITALYQKTAKVFFKIFGLAFAAVMVWVLATERTIFEFLPDWMNMNAVQIHLLAKLIIFSSIIVWVLPVVRYVESQTVSAKRMTILMYAALFTNIITAIFFCNFLPANLIATYRLWLAGSYLSYLLLFFLYYRYSQKLISLVVPVVAFVIQPCMMVTLISVAMSRDYYRFIRLYESYSDMVLPAMLLFAVFVLFAFLFKLAEKRSIQST